MITISKKLITLKIWVIL